MSQITCNHRLNNDIYNIYAYTIIILHAKLWLKSCSPIVVMFCINSQLLPTSVSVRVVGLRASLGETYQFYSRVTRRSGHLLYVQLLLVHLSSQSHNQLLLRQSSILHFFFLRQNLCLNILKIRRWKMIINWQVIYSSIDMDFYSLSILIHF